MSDEHTVIFQPAGRRAVSTGEADLLSIARGAGVDIESACGGKGNCGKCKVRLETQSDGRVSAPTAAELKHLGAEAIAGGMRLACQTRVSGDVKVFVPEESRRVAQVVRKEAGARTVPVDPAVKGYRLTLQAPTLDDHAGDAERLLAALESRHGLTGVSFDLPVLQALPRLLREADWEIVVLVWGPPGIAARVVEVRAAGCTRPILGLAVDVGTTTIAAYLTSLETGAVLATESAMNPQVARGDDVISRLYYATHDPAGLNDLQRCVIEEIERLAARAVERCEAALGDICDVVMVGNTAIHHLFLGLDVRALGRAPFAPAVQEPVDTEASALGFHFHPGCRLHVLPVEAGFVGADNVAVLIAEEPYEQDDVLLIVDIGTNGELVLGNRQRMLSASCATGPALEGAHMEFGMRAAPGAIERLRIDPDTLDVRFKVIGLEGWHDEHPAPAVKARGICGSGIIEAAAEMVRAGVVLPDGGFNPQRPPHERILLENGRPRRFVIAWAEETAIGRAITVSLKDIRAIQLAKAALRAGAEILLQRYGVERPRRIVLAGAFGSYIDAGHALAMGMLPEVPVEDVVSVGNSAGDGARFALLNVGKREEAAWAARSVEYVELASDASFQDEYLRAMRFSPPVPS